jgi:hypothetical protein
MAMAATVDRSSAGLPPSRASLGVDRLDPEAADDPGLVLEQLLQLGTGIG